MGKVGFINSKNQTVLSFEYENAAAFSDGIACVKKNGKWGFIDTGGIEIIHFKHDDILFPNKFVEGEIVFNVNGKKGVMDRNLNMIIQPKYDTLWRIHPGMYHFKIDDLAGVRDRSGNELLTDVVWGSEKYPYA